MLSDKLVASPLAWIIGALIALMCLIPYLLAAAAGNDPIVMLTSCSISIATAVFYAKEAMVTTWILGAIMMLFLKKWRLAAILAIIPPDCIYGLVILGSFVLHAKSIKNMTTGMWGLLLTIYFGDTTSLLILSYILPGLVAFQRKRKSLRKIVLSNAFLAWIPGVWPLLLFIAWKD